MADAFGVSRVPVREALGVLEVSGIISSRQGGGHRVEQHSLLSKYEPLVMEVADHREVEALLEMREVMEQQAARMAAERRTEQELQAIEQAHLAFRHCTLHDGQIGYRQDYLFHRAIMQASHNPFSCRSSIICTNCIWGCWCTRSAKPRAAGRAPAGDRRT